MLRIVEIGPNNMQSLGVQGRERSEDLETIDGHGDPANGGSGPARIGRMLMLWRCSVLVGRSQRADEIACTTLGGPILPNSPAAKLTKVYADMNTIRRPNK